jgi:hypothetical protein
MSPLPVFIGWISYGQELKSKEFAFIFMDEGIQS